MRKKERHLCDSIFFSLSVILDYFCMINKNDNALLTALKNSVIFVQKQLKQRRLVNAHNANIIKVEPNELNLLKSKKTTAVIDVG